MATKRGPWAGTTKAERSAEMKRRRAKALVNRKNKEKTDGSSSAEVTAYAFGYVQAWLHSYEDRLGRPRSSLAGRVGELLLGAQGR